MEVTIADSAQGVMGVGFIHANPCAILAQGWLVTLFFSYGHQLCKRGLSGYHAHQVGGTGSGLGVIACGCLVASSLSGARLPRRCLQRDLLGTAVPLD